MCSAALPRPHSLLALLDARPGAPRSLLSGLRAIDEDAQSPPDTAAALATAAPPHAGSPRSPTDRSTGNSALSPRRHGHAGGDAGGVGSHASAASALASRRSMDGVPDGAHLEAHSSSKKKGRPWAGTRQVRPLAQPACRQTAANLHACGVASITQGQKRHTTFARTCMAQI